MPPIPPDFHISPSLHKLIDQEFEGQKRDEWLSSIQSYPPEARSTLLELLEELDSHSTKASLAALRSWESVQNHLSPSEMVSWIDLGVALAPQSSVTAVKYFRDCPPWFIPLSSKEKQIVLESALDLCDQNYLVVPDFLKFAPQVISILSADGLPLWIEPGIELASKDIVLGVEYFRISPAVLEFLSVEHLKNWANLGMHFVTPNKLGKQDYIRAIEYFRTSPDIFSSFSSRDQIPLFLHLSNRLAEISPEKAIGFFRSGSTPLRSLPGPEMSKHILEHAVRLADRNAEVITDFINEAPKVLRQMDHSISELDRWVEEGLSLLPQGVEKTRAFFSRESKTGQEAAERLGGGITLARYERILGLYAEGLSGRRLAIRPIDELSSQEDSSNRNERPTVYLPSRIRLFAEPQDNFRFYKIATLHEIGHLEFGTYDLDLSLTSPIVKRLTDRFGKDHGSKSVRTADQFFTLFPDPDWARSLWETLEDSRIDYLLRLQYPGVRKDMDRIVAFELNHRPSLQELPPKQAIREALVQLSVTDETDIPLELAEVISKAYDHLLKLKQPNATAVDSLSLLEDLYVLIDQWLSDHPETEGESDPLRKKDASATQNSTVESRGKQFIPSSTLSYRRRTNPDWAKDSSKDDETIPVPPEGENSRHLNSPASSPPSLILASSPSSDTAHIEKSAHSTGLPSSKSTEDPPTSEKSFFYDEWDEGALDYRPRWTQLIERSLPQSTTTFYRETLARHAGAVKLLRRSFETLRPEAHKKLKNQIEGDDLDLDAVLEALVDIQAGLCPQDKLYVRTQKKIRDVSVAFLLDTSGSTSQTIRKTLTRVIDVEKESLVLLSEALHSVGDSYAIFGFSGQGRNKIDFFIVKDFKEDGRWALANRIGSIKPLVQNRDGAAIRHAAFKLHQQPSRTRILILLSDGKPLDSDYVGPYALEDTKMALREARMKGIHPFCITIDREANDYIRKMYGDVRYTIIDNVTALPDRLPQIYRRLTT